MRFLARSLGAKIIIFTALLLLLSMFLSSSLTYALFQLYTDHVAHSNMLPHLSLIKLALIMFGVGCFVLGLSVFVYTCMIRYHLIHPLRQLQARVQTLVANDMELSSEHGDELNMLTRSFSQLSTSLAHESQMMTEQMSNLLIMSDALISTLNLEHLLGEIVSRLGGIMQAKHVSLLLYGREMLSPWAVAQWAEQVVPTSPAANTPVLATNSMSHSRGTVRVNVDPHGDITMAATTKMPAFSGVRSTSSDKQNAVQAP
ncbi:MAG: hypothetical protein JO202_06350, partial [Ktedonobacteraceae bacterium]|nr:hypothetical protein [Ktedonobacteraceae bacterium]